MSARSLSIRKAAAPAAIVAALAVPAVAAHTFAGCAAPSADEPVGAARSALGVTYCINHDGGTAGCPGSSGSNLYATLNDVAGMLQAGDVVYIVGDWVYAQDVVLDASADAATHESDGGDLDASCPASGIVGEIIICGVPGPTNGTLPVLQGTRTSMKLNGDHYIIQNLEVTSDSTEPTYDAGSSEGTNIANRCIWIRSADDITLRNVKVHHCPGHGIQGTDYNPYEPGTGSVTLDYVEVYGAGSGDGKHPIYMTTDEVNHDAGTFTMLHCYIHAGTEYSTPIDGGDAGTCVDAGATEHPVCVFWGGNSVKSRAQRNNIYYNWIEGSQNYELDLIGPEWDVPDAAYFYDGGPDTGASTAPDCYLENDWDTKAREDSDVVGNVLIHTSNTAIVHLGSDGAGQSCGRYRFVNNTYIFANNSGSHVFKIEYGIDSLQTSNDAFYMVDGGQIDLIKDEGRWSQEDGGVFTGGVWTQQDGGPGGPRIKGSNLAITSSPTLEDGGIWSLVATPLSSSDFQNFSTYNLCPVAFDFILCDKGASTPRGPLNHEVPNALSLPGYQPPLQTLEQPGAAQLRAFIKIDVGAYEYGSQ